MENPNNVRDGIDRVYSFGYLELVPEYVSEAAEVEEMDDEEMNKNEIIHTVRVGANYLEKFNSPSNPADKMQVKFPKGTYLLAEIIKTLNHTFDTNKPPGMRMCPGFFDWKYTALDKFTSDHLKFREMAEKFATAYYDDISDPYDPRTHKGYLPPTVNSGPFNDFKLPSHTAILADSRCRMTLLPKFRLSFSNSHILTAMGYSADFIGKRRRNNQFTVSNETNMDTEVKNSQKAPTYRVTLPNDTTVTLSFGAKSNPLNVHVTCTVAECKKISLLVYKLNAELEMVSTDVYGYDLGVKVNTAGKVEFEIVSNETVHFELTATDRFLKILGFPPGLPITSSNYMGKEVVFDKVNVNPEEGLSFSNVLVLDTGPLTVTLKDYPSLTTRGRTDHLMAFLRANGSVSAMIREIAPVALFPSKHHTLTFKIDRNSDKSEIIGLSWPVGCYAHGVLVGTPI